MIATLAIALMLTPTQAEKKTAYVGVQVAITQDKLIYIMRTINDSPAEKAKLQTNDILLKINGVKPPDLATAVKLMQALTPGKTVKFLIERDGKEKEIEVTPVSRE